MVTGEAVVLELPAASPFTRGLSLLLDIIVYVAAWVMIMMMLSWADFTVDPAMDRAIMLGLVVFCFVLIPVTVETLSRGRSLGRLAFGVRIVRDDGGTVRLRHATIRGLVGFLEVVFTVGMLPLFCALFNPRGKRLGDMMAGTYGILVRQPAVRPMMLPVPAHMTSWTQIADLGRIPDNLALRISRLLRRSHQKGNAPVLHLTADRLAEELRPYVSPPPPASSSLEFLTAVMAERRNREYRRLLSQQQRQEDLERRLHSLPYG